MTTINWIRRAAELTVGYTGNWLIVKAFDFVLYPFVIYQLGLVYGGAVMSLLSLVICLLTIWFYDWTKRDWLGIEAVKTLRDYEGASRFRKWTATILRRGNWLALTFLSMKFDPFITTVYMRQGAYNGMSRRDWRIFLASWLIGNIYWIFVCFGGIKLFEWVWQEFVK